MAEKSRITISNLETQGGSIFIALDGGSNILDPNARRRLTAHPTVFVQRNEIRAQLAAKLATAISTNIPTALVLHGPRGSGKSTIAEDICDEVCTKVHRAVASNEPDFSSASPNDLIFVDGFLDGKPRDQAEAWLRALPANFFVITTRLVEGIAAAQSALQARGIEIAKFEMQGLTKDEFNCAVNACETTPGCNPIRLSPQDTDRLFDVTGGLPLAIQLLFNLLGSPMGDVDALAFLAATPPEDVLTELVGAWRRKIVDQDEDLYSTLFAMANVPILGISPDALCTVLAWDQKRIGKTVRQLWAHGLISQVSLNDTALRVHDAIREAFLANEDESINASNLRRRYGAYCRGDPRSKSRISMVDSMLRASETLFGFVERRELDADPIEAYLIFLELRRLQKNIIGADGGSRWRAEKLASWLCEYVKAIGSSLKCNELIAIAGVAQSLPTAQPSLGDSFAPIWERGLETDSTKVTAAMLASVRHWNDLTTSSIGQISRRIERAFDRQPWHAFGNTADIVAAGFAAAHAMIGQYGIGAAYLSGWRIREKGISYREGFAVLLLSIEAKQGPDHVNQFLHYHGSFCRDIDPITTTYLSARGIQCSGAHIGTPIEENLNRQALWGIWSDNQLYCQFVEHVLKVSTKRSDNPPIFVLKRADLNAAANLLHDS